MRPSIYSQEVTAEICERLSVGESLVKICRDDHMPCKATVFKWLRLYPEFMDDYTVAREVQAESHADEIVAIADEDENPARAKLRIDARKWVASKLKPKKYGNFDRLELSGKTETIVSIDEQTMQRVADRLSSLLHRG